VRKEVKVDARGHVSLVGVRTKHHTRYLAEEDPDGTIHLMPAVLVPAILKEPSAEGGLEFKRTRDPLEILRDYFPDAKELTR
jgi:hypothetical protein